MHGNDKSVVSYHIAQSVDTNERSIPIKKCSDFALEVSFSIFFYLSIPTEWGWCDGAG